MLTGLFFGSFNPIHIGHLAIANYVVEYTDIKELWFVVSPQNPLKKRKGLLPDYHRITLVREAIEEDKRFRASDIEFKMPQPSYTIDTLTYLQEKYPGRKFAIVMGADGLTSFHKWKNYEEIIKNYPRYIYPRPNVDIAKIENKENCIFMNAPLIEISSTFIRNGIREGKDMRYLLNERVYKYISEMHFYEK